MEMNAEYIAVVVGLFIGLLLLRKIFGKIFKFVLMISVPLFLGLLAYLLLSPN